MLYTGYYANMAKIPPNEQYHFVSISRGNPSWFREPLLDMEELKPSWELVELAKTHDYAAYVEKYQAQLAQADLREIMQTLPDESILLCYEVAEKFCHRHMVAHWLMKKGILCREITF